MWLYYPSTYALVPQFLKWDGIRQIKHILIGRLIILFSIPVFAVAGVSITMERIGRTGENPFEGTANDVPILPLHEIEIDLRQIPWEKQEDFPFAHLILRIGVPVHFRFRWYN